MCAGRGASASRQQAGEDLAAKEAMPKLIPIVRVRGRSRHPSLARVADRLQSHALELLEDAESCRDANEALVLLDVAARIHGRPSIAYEVERLLRGAA